MTTQLSAQLQRLRQHEGEERHLAVSFLFDKTDARSFSREQVLQLAAVGMQTLVALDNRFHPFLATLFDPHRTRQERRLLTSDESRKLDLRLEHFLTLLSPHLFLTAAQQVFEYLVRVHEVHVYNTTAVLRAFLPYHDHNLFARVLLLLDLRDTGFDFLRTNQERGAVLLRDHLTLACGESRTALRLVCLTAAMPLRLGIANHAALSLFAAVAVALATHHQAESLWRTLLPFVLECLGAPQRQPGEEGEVFEGGEGEVGALAAAAPTDQEAVCAALLVLSVWSAEARFTAQALSALLQPVTALLAARTSAGSATAAAAASVPLADLLSVAELLFRTQGKTVASPAFAAELQPLLSLPWAEWAAPLSGHFASLEAAGAVPLRCLLGTLTDHCIGRLRVAQTAASVPAAVMQFLRTAAAVLPLTEPSLEALVRVCVEKSTVPSGDGNEEEEDGGAGEQSDDAVFAEVLACVERRHQGVFDATLASMLQAAGTPAASAAASFLQRHLGGTRYQMVSLPPSAHSEGGPAQLPLFACLLHTLPSVRTLAADSVATLSIGQLLSSASASASSSSSLLDLFTHVVECESHADAGRPFLRTAAHVLGLLLQPQPQRQKEEAERESIAGVKALLRALSTMVSNIPPLRADYAALLARLASGAGGESDGSAASKKSKPTRKASPSPSLTSSVAKEADGCVLYYLALLYVSAAGDGDAATEALLAPVLQSRFPQLTPAAGPLFDFASVAAPSNKSSRGKNKKKKKTGKGDSSSSSSSDDDDGDDDNSSGKGANKAPGTATHVDLFSCAELASAVQAEATERLPLSQDRALAVVRDPRAGAAQRHAASCELALAAAAGLAAAPAATVASLLPFIARRYLPVLVEAQRAAARQAGGAAEAAVGGGATNSVLHSVFLPRDAMTKRLAVAVCAAVRVCLRGPASAVQKETLVSALELLGCLGAALPPMAEDLQRLPAALLALLCSHSAAEWQRGFGIEWLALVWDSVYGAATKGGSISYTQAALVALALLPLQFPPSGRPAAVAQWKAALPPTAPAGLAELAGAMVSNTAPLPPAAAAYVASALGLGGASMTAAVVPHRMAAAAIEFFFPATATRAGGGVPLAPLLPSLLAVLEAPSAAVTAGDADFLEAVCQRAVLAGEGAKGAADSDAVRLCEALLRHPLVVTGGEAESTTRPVYRHALRMLAVALSTGSAAAQEAADGGAPLIFTKAGGNKKKSSNTDGGVVDEGFAAAVALRLTPALLAGVSQISSDVARLIMLTKGGYYRVFLPLLEGTAAAKAGAASEASLTELADLLEVLTPTEAAAATAWMPPVDTTLAQPLRYRDALALLKLLEARVPLGSDGQLPRSPLSAQCLQMLTIMLRVSPSIAYDEENDKDDGDEESVLRLTLALLRRYPLDSMRGLLTPSATSSSGLDVFMGGQRLLQGEARQVLAYLSALTTLCADQAQTLAARDASGALRLRSLLLKQCLTVMAALLLTEGEEEAAAQGGSGEADAESAEDLTRQKVDVISELLRAMAPLLSSPHKPSAQSESDSDGDFYLHIPLVALLVRLEAVELTDALRFRSAADACSDILSSFDIHTQMSCVARLAELVMDPEGQLTGGGRHHDGEGEEEEEEGGEGNAEVLRLFRRMIKPNQVINRQEIILNIIATAVKSDTFLGPFIALQHQSTRNTHRSGKQQQQQQDAAAGEGEGEEESSEVNSRCRRLLVSSLELFSHYSELNRNTPNDADQQAGGSEYGEQKAYTMVLELLAGNTLACVLAGINESTFVECLQQLLSSRSAALQFKGLEVLLDRLHHSLPTLEATLTDAEVEQRRRDLRDPRKKLTLEDLVRIKARPLVTKRSFVLMGRLTQLLEASAATVLAETQAATSATAAAAVTTVQLSLPLTAYAQLFSMAQLSVACVEELVRVVASGGSTQAERTLLNANRAKKVTEAALTKLFGKKSNVTQVHEWVDHVCAQLLPQLTQGLHRVAHPKHSTASAGATGAHTVEVEAFRMTSEEGLLSTMSGVLTAAGTVAQVMGAAFVMPHCLPLLHALTATSLYAVVELPPLMASRAAGSLLRHTALSSLIRCFPSCWQMSQPYLSRILFVATHWTNVNDGETHYLCTEMLTVLEALMEPQLFLEAATACLQGIPYANTAVVVGADVQQAALAATREAAEAEGPAPTAGSRRMRSIRLQVNTHSFQVFFQCLQSRVLSLTREELTGIAFLMEGTTAKENVWLAALGVLAAHAALAPRESVQPVYEAFTAFFLKFKQKHCVRVLRMMALWAFGGEAAALEQSLKKKEGEADRLGRTTLHTWVLFYDLVHHLLHTLGPIFDFGFPVVSPYLVTTLQTYCDTSKPPGGAGGRPMAPLLARVLESALACVEAMAAAQTPGPGDDYTAFADPYFGTAEVFASLMPVLARQMTNVSYLSDGEHDYAYRAEHSVIPTLRAFMKALEQSPKCQARTQTELLRGLRSPSRHVRRMTVQLFDGIYADGGEELASRLMAELLPPVVELTEDRDDDVVEAARRLCLNLSNITGQDVLHAMS